VQKDQLLRSQIERGGREEIGFAEILQMVQEAYGSQGN
jgi:hypothetical protein